jgi:hypothetical protein
MTFRYGFRCTFRSGIRSRIRTSGMGITYVSRYIPISHIPYPIAISLCSLLPIPVVTSRSNHLFREAAAFAPLSCRCREIASDSSAIDSCPYLAAVPDTPSPATLLSTDRARESARPVIHQERTHA